MNHHIVSKLIIGNRIGPKYLICFEGEEELMYGITYGGYIDELAQVFLSALVVYALYGTNLDRYAILPLLTPLIIDSDHFLPLYSSGIKAFHSAIFISLLVAPFIIYGFVRMNRKFIFAGAVTYVIAILNISMDLLEGGAIFFMYPFSSTRYVLQESLSYNMTLSILFLVGFSMTAVYLLKSYLDLDRTGFTAEPHIGHSRIGSSK